MSEAKLKIVGGASDVGDEELRQWLEKFIEEHPKLPTKILGRSDHIGMSKTALDAYIKGTYFLAESLGGSGTNPANSKLEPKIRAYREKVEGSIRHGYTNAFLETRLWQQFQYTCKTAIDEKAICVGYGRPGIGKSRSVQHYKTEKMTTMPIEILCSANITTRYFVQKLAQEVGLDDSVPTARLEDMIADKLKKNAPRLIFVDQANYLNEKGLGTICHLWERARVPIVLLGTKELFNLFMTSTLTEDVRAQLTSRIAWHCAFMELSLEEVKTIVVRMLGPKASSEVVKQIYETTSGVHRHLDMMLPRLSQLVGKNETALEAGEVSMHGLVERAGLRLMVG